MFNILHCQRVTHIVYRTHTGRAGRRTVQINYFLPSEQYPVREYVCPEHDGRAREGFLEWWEQVGGEGRPRTCEEVIDFIDHIGIWEPDSISTAVRNGWPVVTDRFFNPGTNSRGKCLDTEFGFIWSENVVAPA